MRFLKNRLLFVLMAISTCAFAQRRQISFDEGWKFHFGNAGDPSKDFNYGITAIFAKSGKTDNTALALNFKDSAWRDLNLPHDWAVELPFAKSPNFDVQSHGYKPVGGLYPETSIGWYRKHFSIVSKDSGQRFQIQFDGVFRDAQFWINGFYLGNNQSGYVGVNYDITDYINYNRDNVLTVRVDATQYEGWFYEGAGIYRHVWLNQYQNLHIPAGGQFVHSSVKGNAATVKIETEVENQGTSETKFTVSSYITDRNGKKLAQSPEQSSTLQVNGHTRVQQSLSVSNPHLWDLEYPYLYRVVSLIKKKRKNDR